MRTVALVPAAFGLLLAVGVARPASTQSVTQPAAAPAGQELYLKLCSQCHGEKGDGAGVAAPRLPPPPRDFTAGKFKIRSTPNGALPTDDDLRRILRRGMPYTSMPAWPQLSDQEIDALVAVVKSFSPDFANPERRPQPIELPKAPAYTDASAAKGKAIYEQMGCAACHGQLGRGDGPSAPTLADDWGHPLRPADLTMRWTYRGGPSREDIYRTFTTGLNGTPMPSFAEALSDEERWQLVDYIASLDARESPEYSQLLRVAWSDEELDVGRGAELFASAPPAHFPIVGQITEPGRAFQPAASGITVRAVYNPKEIAFQLSWHDMRADTGGRNAPDLAVPASEESPAAAVPAPAAGAETGDFWGEEAAPSPPPAAPPPPASEDGGDLWGVSREAAAATPTAGGEFSDAVAIQLPAQPPAGNRRPYFLFGDAESPVDLWFLDLATQSVRRYAGRGSASLAPSDDEDVAATARYDQGEWTVVFKRALRTSGGVTFAEAQYLPIAFSVWDGTSRERGNRRGLTQWQYLYTLPRKVESPFVPMLQAALAVVAVEILLVAWVRRRHAAASAP